MWHTSMHTNMNFPAPIAVLGFLAAVAGLALCSLAAVVFAMLHKIKWTRWVGGLVAAGAVVYFGLLFGFSLGSREVTLAPGQEKYFCEIDCHLAYSLQTSREEMQDGQRRLLLTLRTRFDQTTTAPWRPKDAPLTPNAREVRLVDSRGRSYAPDVMSGTPLTRSLVPAQSYETELIFRLPADASGLRLLITTSGWDERLLIGEENSLGHKKTYLAVPTGRDWSTTASN
jgi:hypothetical protein